ncbi:MauE/DoxX family redox-associated membrane protein [Actinomadura sp. 7K534]|uniref:MauE/DoxX family redox-associated membrane protein n=1 Tax=Actinomadura sp. 7K534 TaxID=2530366 RepID=UPI001049F92C|nr:MauE/DoxX family redox-associated membrane protein [Actinomadura sp. 7K534]TDB95825.1 hypothetical protein E1266_11885 [Actinomadura sp. 7K534]
MTGVVSIGCGVLLSSILAASVLGKVRNLPSLMNSLIALGFARGRVSSCLAGMALVAEAGTLGIFIVSPVAGREAAFLAFALSTGLLTAFTLTIIIALKRGLIVRCACFGKGGEVFSRRHVARNMALVLAALAGGGATACMGEVDWRLVPGPVLTGIVGATFLIFIDDLVDLFS